MRFSLFSRIIKIMVLGWFCIAFFPRDGVCEQDQDRKAKSLAAYIMGVVYDMQGKVDAAIQEYQKSSMYNDHYAAHLRVGTDYARTGRLEEAIAEFDKVLKVDKENVQARYLMALVYSSQQKYDKAADNYEVILKTYSQEQPDNVEIYGYLGQLYYAKREFDKAIAQYEKVLAFQPNNVDVMYVLGSLYLEKQNRVKAKEKFSLCIDYKPDHDGCLNALGFMYAEDGVNLNEAKDYIERALAVDAKNAAYLDSLGWVYYRLGNDDKALEYLLQANALIKDPTIYDHLGDVYFRINKIDQAKKYWKLSLQALPHQPAVEKKLNSVATK